VLVEDTQVTLVDQVVLAEEVVITNLQGLLELVMQEGILLLKEIMVDLLDLIQLLDLKPLEEAAVVQVQLAVMEQEMDLEALEDREQLIQLQDHLSQEAAVAEDLQEKVEDQQVAEAPGAEAPVQIVVLLVEPVQVLLAVAEVDQDILLLLQEVLEDQELLY
jgi:hypothetical protein